MDRDGKEKFEKILQLYLNRGRFTWKIKKLMLDMRFFNDQLNCYGLSLYSSDGKLLNISECGNFLEAQITSRFQRILTMAST
jgi:hypothetical protein